MAGTAGLEPVASGVTGRRSNQTELRPRVDIFCKALGSGFGPTAIALVGGNGGRRNRTRTCDPRLVRPMLSQLSYPPKSRGRAPGARPRTPFKGTLIYQAPGRLSSGQVTNEPPYPRICRPRTPEAAHRAPACTGRWPWGRRRPGRRREPRPCAPPGSAPPS